VGGAADGDLWPIPAVFACRDWPIAEWRLETIDDEKQTFL
jgi:hypothetical protein